MNKYEINGKTLDNGSYVLIKKDDTNLNEKDAFLFVVDGGATLKRYKKNARQVYLLPESTEEYHNPIVLSQYDDVRPGGKVVDVFSF